MADVSIIQPNVGTEARFVFKDPVARHVKSKLNTSEDKVLFTTTSVVDLEEIVQIDLRDPYQEIYYPLGLTEFQYQEDLRNNIPVLSLRHKSISGSFIYIRCPASYVETYDHVADISYINKVLVIDLGSVPEDLDASIHFPDLKDFILTRLGVNTEVAEVSVGDPQSVSRNDHDTLETIRGNRVTVKKTLTIQLAEMTQRYDQILARLDIMGIKLG